MNDHESAGPEATPGRPAKHLQPVDPTVPLDARRHAFRPDLAADNLRGRVEAERFVAGNWGQVVVPSIQIRNKPDTNAAVDTEALFGEVVVVYDVAGGWAWVQERHTEVRARRLGTIATHTPYSVHVRRTR